MWLMLGCSGLARPLEQSGDAVSADAGSDAGVLHPGDGGDSKGDASLEPVDAGAAADAGPTEYIDGGVDACPAGAIFCESFENGIDSSRWRRSGDAQTFSVDNTVARDGRGSLHMAYGAPYGHTGQQYLTLVPAIPAPEDRVYLRAYMRFENLVLPGAHPAFVDVIDSAQHELGFGSIYNDFALLGWVPGAMDNSLVWSENKGPWRPTVEDGDSTPDTEQSLKAKTWFCLEMMYFGDHQGPQDTNHDAEEVRVWIDGTEIPELHATDAAWTAELGHAPPEHWSPIYDNASWMIGLVSFGPQNVALDVWFDAIVLSHSRVGCIR